MCLSVGNKAPRSYFHHAWNSFHLSGEKETRTPVSKRHLAPQEVFRAAAGEIAEPGKLPAKEIITLLSEEKIDSFVL